MKRSLIVIAILSLLLVLASCKADNPVVQDKTNIRNNGEVNDTMSNQIKIRIGASVFTATLLDNAAVTAFKSMLPMTINMNELNGNEKYFYLSANLPANASNPGTINKGDLMLWGSNCLVLFYKTFSTSYNYTRLGCINDTTGLAAAVGSGNVTVTFESL